MGFSSSAIPQRLQPARVLFELRQLILAIDGHHTLQQLSRLGDLAFILSDPGEQGAGPLRMNPHSVQGSALWQLTFIGAFVLRLRYYAILGGGVSLARRS